MEYREITALNQSILKKILDSPQDFLKAKRRQEQQEETTEEHFIFGSLVDLMLTGNRKEFNAKYAVIDDETNCSAGIKLIVDGVFKDLVEQESSILEFTFEDMESISLETLETSILNHCKYQNYYPNWKDDTRVAAVIKAGSKYFETLKTTVGKTVISQSEYAKAVNCKASLQVDQFAREFVVEKSKPNREFLDKFIVNFNWQGHDIKGELDRVVIDHNTKTIIPIDFKTTSKSVLNFNSDFWYYRYDFQAAVYHKGLFLTKDTVISKLISEGYVVEDFLYIVVEKNLNNPPMIFKVGAKVLDVGFSGGTLANGKELEGFKHAIMRYDYATINDAWDYPMEYYMNGGSILIEP